MQFLSFPFLTFIAIYPREGTETRAIMMVVVLDWLLQFIPARGRKPLYFNAHALAMDIAIYPREGTETLGVGGVSRNLPIAIYPREGTETGLFP